MSRQIEDSAVGRVVVNDSGGDLRKFIAAHSYVILWRAMKKRVW